MTIGGAVAVSAAIIAGGIFEIPKLIKRRARGQYADLANRLDDTDQAAIVGKQLLETLNSGPDAGATADNAIRKAAADLRNQLKYKPLQEMYAADINAGLLLEAGGWVMPATLAVLCIMTADTR
jgi:hypothetical protein